MSGGALRDLLIIHLDPSVLCEFCLVMDGLADLDWTRFASKVLRNQTLLRLAEKQPKRTDWVLQVWGNQNAAVGDLLDLLDSLNLLRPRDVILSHRPGVAPHRSAPPPPPVPCPETPEPPPTVDCVDSGGKLLPGPAPPPDRLYSHPEQEVEPDAGRGAVAVVTCSKAPIMRWPYAEVHAGTRGFSAALQVGEGGFGVVYRATLSNTDCAVKRLRQDGPIDWSQLKKSFQTEVEKLSKFRHRNIVDLLGFSEGGGTMCLIYSYMENRSLEDQIHNVCALLSWPSRVAIVEGAAAALQFLHHPPAGQEQLIHGDVKSSNILLDQHLVAKLSDFGLARYAPPAGSGGSASRTGTVGRTGTVRGTLAYLPDEYLLRGKLSSAVDVYSFGVVLLEVLTGRRALERDGSRDRYLKDLVQEVQSGPDGSVAAWRTQLDPRLISGGPDGPVGLKELVDLACRSLSDQRKMRPDMKEVFEKLKMIHSDVMKASSSSLSLHPCPYLLPPPQPLPTPLCSLDVDLVSQRMSKLGPLEHSYPSLSSSSSSSSCALTPPHPLHSSIFTPPSSFVGPCETDESRGFSQYHPPSQFWSMIPSSRDQNRGPSPVQEPNPAAGIGGFSPAGSLRSTSPGPPVQMNPSKQRLLEKTRRYEEGQIGTPELLSSAQLYAASSGGREPEESDELDYLPDRTC